jgi:hypothetical protein
MATRISTSARNAAANAVAALVDAGAGAGTILVRTGAQPTNVGDADTGTLLGTLTCSDPASGAASTGVCTFNAITSDTSADNSGTAGHFRLKDSTGAIVLDGTCGLGSGDMSFDNNVIVAGGVIAVTSFTLTMPIT